MNLKPRSAEAFFTLAIAWSWVIWGVAILTGTDAASGAGTVLLALGGLGPLVAASVLIRLSTPAEQLDYVTRLTRLREIGPAWGATALLLVPALVGLAVLISRSSFELVPPQPVWRVLTALILLTMFGPFAQELGWRGFALDRIQARTNALSASLTIGVVWAAWHLPLFAFAGTWQHGIGLGTEAFWGFMLALPLHSILLTWVYNNTGGSIPAAVLMHLSFTLVVQWVRLTAEARHDWLLLTALGAAAVSILWGPSTLRRPVWSKKDTAAA